MALVQLGGCAAPKPKAELVYFPAPPAQARVVHLKSFNSIEELIPRRAHWLDSFLGEATSTSVGTPSGLAYRDDHLYICDTTINAVQDWDISTGKVTRIGGDGTLRKPISVAVDDNRHMYVADTARGEIVEFDAQSKYVRSLKPPAVESYRPVALCVVDKTLYAADISRHSIDRFSLSDGSHIGSIGAVGSGVGQLYYPMGVAGRGGEVYVSDSFNGRVQVFRDEGKPPRTFGQPGDRYGDLGKPKQLSVGPDGTVFVADPDFAHVHLFNKEGQLLMLLGGPEDRAGGTPMPVSTAVCEFKQGPPIEVDSVTYPTYLVPSTLSQLVPADFDVSYFLFVANTVGSKRISLFAVGLGHLAGQSK